MELALARYRLMFKHPFGTAHGLRDGTDAVFVRLSRGGRHGYGEATLPPYLPYSQQSVYEELCIVDLDPFLDLEPPDLFRSEDKLVGLSPPAHAAIVTAYYDLISKDMNMSVGSMIGSTERRKARNRTMVTLGHTQADNIALKLSELPKSSVLKVKLGSPNDLDLLDKVKSLDNRPLFLDVNQGWGQPGQALAAIATAGRDRVIGIEQPFAKDRWDLHRELRSMTDVPIYGDESIQGMADLERARESFDGVNLKLMKCGGLDTARAMAQRAEELGLGVMLGSMSESSLGCAAMASLAGMADLIDLDGPWLITNDPFKGLEIEGGELVVNGTEGIGVELNGDHPLEFNPIGA